MNTPSRTRPPATRLRWRRLSALRRDRAGAAALEFALVMPVMVTLLFGVVDATRALIAWRQVTSTAQSATEIATALASQANDGTYQLTVAQGYAASTAIYAIMPMLKAGTDHSAFAVTISGVAFTITPPGCTTACTYVAQTAWSVVGSYDILETRTTLPQLRRACGVLAQVVPTAPPSLTTLPTLGMTTLNSLVVADVLYVFQPLFLKFFTGPISMRRSAYLPPRVGSAAAYVEYDAPNAATNTNVCTGYL